MCATYFKRLFLSFAKGWDQKRGYKNYSLCWNAQMHSMTKICLQNEECRNQKILSQNLKKNQISIEPCTHYVCTVGQYYTSFKSSENIIHSSQVNDFRVCTHTHTRKFTLTRYFIPRTIAVMGMHGTNCTTHNRKDPLPNVSISKKKEMCFSHANTRVFPSHCSCLNGSHCTGKCCFFAPCSPWIQDQMEVKCSDELMARLSWLPGLVSITDSIYM